MSRLPTGLSADGRNRADITGDVRPTAHGGGVIHVHGKGRKDRRIPLETKLIDPIGDHLATRAVG